MILKIYGIIEMSGLLREIEMEFFLVVYYPILIFHLFIYDLLAHKIST